MWVATVAILGCLCVPNVAVAGSNKIEVAIQVAEQARLAFEERRYEDAAAMYMRAYNLAKDKVVMVYNAARSHQLGGRLEAAKALFELYIRIANPRVTDENSGILAAKENIAKIEVALEATVVKPESVVIRPTEPKVVLPTPATVATALPEEGTRVVAPQPKEFPLFKVGGASAASALSLGLWLAARGQINTALGMLPVQDEAGRSAYKSAISQGEGMRAGAVGAGVVALGLGVWAAVEYLSQ